MAQFSYKETLKKSFKAIFLFPQIFIPMIISLLIGFFIAPQYNQSFMLNDPSMMVSLLPTFLLFFLISTLLGLLVYAWKFRIIRQIVKHKKVNLKNSLLESPSMAWKLFKIFILLGFLLMISYLLSIIVVIILGVVLSLIGLGFISFILMALVAFAFFLLIFFISLPLTPILILEDFTVIKTLSKWWDYLGKQKSHIFKMGLISFLCVFIAYIPYLTFMIVVGPVGMMEMMTANMFTYLLRVTLIFIPGVAVATAMMIFYCFAYLKNK